MLIVIKSPPGSSKALKAVIKAAELAADIVLVGEAVCHAVKDGLEGFCGTAFALEGDARRLLPGDTELEKGVKLVTEEEIEEMLGKEENSGPF